MANEPERWLPVPGHGDVFVASSWGRIAKVAGYAGAAGYVQVSFKKEMVPFKAHSTGRKQPLTLQGYAHHLVCLAFHGQPPVGKTQVNHKDLNRSNNRPENLEWCNQQENLAHWRRMNPGRATCEKPYKSSIRGWKLIREYRAQGWLLKELAEKFGLSKSGISHILNSPKYREAA